MKYKVRYCDLRITTINALDTSNICWAHVFAKNETEASEMVKGGDRYIIIQQVTEMEPDPASLRQTLDEDELGLVLMILEAECKRSKSIANRPMQGYGKASEESKKEVWARRANEIELISNKLAEAFI
jgi:hypothetical protein